jgi:hypothetical protein
MKLFPTTIRVEASQETHVYEFRLGSTSKGRTGMSGVTFTSLDYAAADAHLIDDGCVLFRGSNYICMRQLHLRAKWQAG